MMKHLLPAKLAMVLTLFFVRCSPPEHQLLGRWKRDHVIIQIQNGNTGMNARIVQTGGAGKKSPVNQDLLVWSDIKIIKDNEYQVYAIEGVIDQGAMGINFKMVSKKFYSLFLENDGTRLSLKDRKNGKLKTFQTWEKVPGQPNE